MDLAIVTSYPSGLFVLHWTDGGASAAAVGRDAAGRPWFAPANWVGGVPCYDWARVRTIDFVCGHESAERAALSLRALVAVPVETVRVIGDGRLSGGTIRPLLVAALADTNNDAVLSALRDELDEVIRPAAAAPGYDDTYRDQEWWAESGLSVRARNAVRRALTHGRNVPLAGWSVAQLAALSDRTLLDQRHCGAVTLAHIRDWLRARRTGPGDPPPERGAE